jgi:hypothetical protein
VIVMIVVENSVDGSGFGFFAVEASLVLIIWLVEMEIPHYSAAA